MQLQFFRLILIAGFCGLIFGCVFEEHETVDSLVTTFFRSQNVWIVSFFSCCSSRKYFLEVSFIRFKFSLFEIGVNVEVSRMMSLKGFQTRFLQNAANGSRTVDTPKNTVQGFVIDLSCSRSFNVYQQVNNFQKIME